MSTARQITAIVAAVIAAVIEALVVYQWHVQECSMTSLFVGVIGYTLLLGGAWAFIDEQIKEREQK